MWYAKTNQEAVVKIRQFAEQVCSIEGKKKQVNIAQVLEILKAVNQMLDGKLYAIIRAI